MSNKANYDIMWYENGKTQTGYVVTQYDYSISNDPKMFNMVLETTGTIGVWKWKPYAYKEFPYVYYFPTLYTAIAALNSIDPLPTLAWSRSEGGPWQYHVIEE
jgi:hypothetical protein